MQKIDMKLQLNKKKLRYFEIILIKACFSKFFRKTAMFPAAQAEVAVVTFSHSDSTPDPKFFIRCQAKFLTSRHVHMRKVLFYISNTLRKLMIGA